MKIYYKQFREKINFYEKIRGKIDFNFKLAQNISVRTHQPCKSQNVEKLNKNFDSIGCSQSFSRKLILYQLHGNMTEEKYGSIWNINPCYLLSKTNLCKETNVFKFAHWIFLGPMYSNKSISKGSKIDNRLYLMQEIKA